MQRACCSISHGAAGPAPGCGQRISMKTVPFRKLGGVIAASVVLVALTACQSAGESPVATQQALQRIFDPNINLETSLSTTYYPVSGTSTEAIFADIETNGPSDDSGQRGSGLTSVVWGYEWQRDTTSDGECVIDSMTIRADMTIELPQHTDEASLDASTLANWREYADGVAAHEQRHVDIYLAGANDIKNALEEVGSKPDCDELKDDISTIWSDQQSRINSLQEAFHSEEDLRLSASRGPIEQQIEINRAALDVLQSQISQLDQQIRTVKAEIDALDAEVERIDAQIQQINDQFQGTLPATVHQRLQDLLQQGNDLLSSYNAKVEEHNSALSQRASLVGEYDALLAATNDLVDDFNWAR